MNSTNKVMWLMCTGPFTALPLKHLTISWVFCFNIFFFWVFSINHHNGIFSKQRFSSMDSKGQICGLYTYLSGGWIVWHFFDNVIKQLVHASACVCRDIEHAGSLESTKEATLDCSPNLPKCSISQHTDSWSMN